LKVLKSKNFDSVKTELIKWINVNKKPVAGLEKRRKAEIELFYKEI
jgi:GH24 family phage-related lysozyme (muramidase)